MYYISDDEIRWIGHFSRRLMKQTDKGVLATRKHLCVVKT